MARIMILLLMAGFAASATARTPDGKPLAVLIAGSPSHEPGGHEHNAGVRLFANALAEGAPQVTVKVHLDEEWPALEELDQADTVLLYCDAGGEVLAKGDRVTQLGKQMRRGGGLIVVHYALALAEVGTQALTWLGGFKDPGWSVNPTWEANYRTFPVHPITRGVQPFSAKDEWYYHMRFTKDAGAVTPILTDLPTLESLESACCNYVSNPAVVADLKAGKPQTTAWAFERKGGGRSFGFTGGHFHANWGNDELRKLLLNAILWTANVEVPLSGVESRVTERDLKANLDPKTGD